MLTKPEMCWEAEVTAKWTEHPREPAALVLVAPVGNQRPQMLTTVPRVRRWTSEELRVRAGPTLSCSLLPAPVVGVVSQ